MIIIEVDNSGQIKDIRCTGPPQNYVIADIDASTITKPKLTRNDFVDLDKYIEIKKLQEV
jgi:hypothetical protein